MTEELKPGRYRHYKGNLYHVHSVAIHTETGERMAVYQALYGQMQMFVRPLDMFRESVQINGQMVPRFQYLEPPYPQLYIECIGQAIINPRGVQNAPCSEE